MTTAPTEIVEYPFSTAVRGFDRNEVRHVLAELADSHADLMARAERAEARLEDARTQLASVEKLLRDADGKYQAAQSHLAEVENERAAQRQRYAETQDGAAREFSEKVTEVLQAAMAAARSIRAEAEEWAADHRRQAAEDAHTMVASARHEVAEMRAREEAAVAHLQDTQLSLRNWLQAARVAVGRMLDQPLEDLDELAVRRVELPELDAVGEGRESTGRSWESVALSGPNQAQAGTVPGPTGITGAAAV